MNHDDEFDELLDTVLGAWTPARPSAEFRARVVEAVRRPPHKPMNAKPSRFALLPILAFVVAAAAVLLLRPTQAPEPDTGVQVVAPVLAPVAAASREERAEARLEFCKLAADVEAANARFPFDPEGSDLWWTRFVSLYGPTGRVAVWESGLLAQTEVSPSAKALLAHARELRITLFGNAWEPVPQLRLELQLTTVDPKHRAERLDREQKPRCTLAVGRRSYACGSVQGALWRAGYDDEVTLTFLDKAGVPTGTMTSSGPWALLRFLRTGRAMKLDEANNTHELRFRAKRVEPIQMIYRWMAGAASPQTQELLTSPVPVPLRLFEGDPACGSVL